MGLGTENIARKFGITREQADQFPPIRTRKLSRPSPPEIFKDETIRSK